MRLYEIYFSPTGGTKKVADIIANGIGTLVLKIDMIKCPETVNYPSPKGNGLVKV